ncbi:hypothetical protein [Azoarcus sp. CIB]|nr:hypothetical protein [Azoarcus sp. CIB]
MAPGCTVTDTAFIEDSQALADLPPEDSILLSDGQLTRVIERD